MRILFVTPRLPLPADTGAKIRTFNLLKNVAQSNDVTLLSFYFEDDPKAVEKIKNLGIEVHLVKAKEQVRLEKVFTSLPISIEKYHSQDLAKKLQELLSNTKFDLVHFDHLHMGQYRDCVNGVPAVLDEHNVESVILERCVDIEKNPLKRVLFKSQAKKMAQFESRLVRWFSRCLTVSESDRENLFKLSDYKANIEVIPNGVDTEYFSLASLRVSESLDCARDAKGNGEPTEPLASCKEEGAIVFTSSMDWLPNSDAVLYFCGEILPLIWTKNNRVKFYVIGKNPSKEVINLAKQDNRIIVTGVVEDVRPYIAKSKVFVAPIRIGGGTRLKILEAMAMEKAVVSTRVGAEGIAYTEDKDIILKDLPQDFADAVLILLEDNQKRDALGKAGRDLVCRNYDWNIIGEKLNQVYRKVVENDRQR